MFRGAMYPVDYFFLAEDGAKKNLYSTSGSDDEGSSIEDDDDEMISEDDDEEFTEISLGESRDYDQSMQEDETTADKYRDNNDVRS